MTEQQTGSQGPTPLSLAPHRGVVILVLGIVGIVCCFICGIVAWVMGNSDLRQMAEGKIDPSGQGLTQAGKICGIVSVVLAILGLTIWILAIAAGVGARLLPSF
jgi:hypothetical protein